MAKTTRSTRVTTSGGAQKRRADLEFFHAPAPVPAPAIALTAAMGAAMTAAMGVALGSMSGCGEPLESVAIHGPDTSAPEDASVKQDAAIGDGTTAQGDAKSRRDATSQSDTGSRIDGGPPGPDAPSPSPSPSPAGNCDQAFLGPFCTGTVCDSAGNCEVVESNPRIIGFDLVAPAAPTLAQARAYSLAAVNALRARTCLAPLVLDECLNQIAEEALAANSGHGYFIANCMNASHGYGRRCACHWAQENIGAASGTRRTWVDGVQSPLCRMMTEAKGTGHRSNIEASVWKRLGVGIRATSNGATWYHEFGCDPTLPECPKK